MSTRPLRRVGIVIALATLVATAGCAGMLGDGQNGTDGPTTDEPTNDGTADATDEADPAEPDTTATPGTGTDEGGTVAEAAASGEFLLVLDGESTMPDATGDAVVRINETSHQWQTTESSVTLASALEDLGYTATESTLETETTTYDASANDTSLSYRVDGVPVAPSEYELEDGDAVHVIAYEGNVSTPGEYVSDEVPHPHGSLNVTVDGDPVDLTVDRYEMNDRYFHFHNDTNEPYWHGHSNTITFQYAISAFDGMNVRDSGAFTIDGETYGGSFDGNVTYLRSGEPVDPSRYVVRDGDQLRVVVSTDE